MAKQLARINTNLWESVFKLGGVRVQWFCVIILD
jgi:hypothetical protein